MAYSRKLLEQLGRPQGLIGHLILWHLNYVNREMNKLTLELLNLRSDDRVLEIGFGGGALLAKILAKGGCIRLAGVDVSELALSRAEKRFKHDIARGQIEFAQSGAFELPYPERSFSKICCVNVIYFWTDLLVNFSEIYRVLEPNGTLVLCYAEGSPDMRTRFTSKEVEAKLISRGFVNIQTLDGNDRENGLFHCTLAEKRC